MGSEMCIRDRAKTSAATLGRFNPLYSGYFFMSMVDVSIYIRFCKRVNLEQYEHICNESQRLIRFENKRVYFIPNCACYFFMIGIDIKADGDETFIK